MKTEEQLLEQYYYENCYYEKPFSELTQEDKKMISGLWGFAFFKASEALKEVKEAVKKTLHLN